jgi:hypothetical protein
VPGAGAEAGGTESVKEALPLGEMGGCAAAAKGTTTRTSPPRPCPAIGADTPRNTTDQPDRDEISTGFALLFSSSTSSDDEGAGEACVCVWNWQETRRMGPRHREGTNRGRSRDPGDNSIPAPAPAPASRACFLEGGPAL